VPDQQQLRDVGRLRYCPECRVEIPILHAAAFALHKGPHRWTWKVASYCLVCEAFFVVRCSSPPPGRSGSGRPRVRFAGRAQGPEVEIAHAAVFDHRGATAPLQAG